MELQMLDQQIKQYQKQVQLIEQQMVELNSVKENLDDIKKLKQGAEILAPLSSGIFAKASIKDTNELLVNVGSDVIVKKDVDSAKALIDKQLGEMEEVHTQMQGEVQKLAFKGSSLQDELAKLVEDKK
jgi:prefoldin alpha subunit